MIFCYKGEGYNYSSVRIAGLKTIASGFPKGQERLKKETKVKIDGGLSAIVELWRGAVDASGTTAFLQVPMGIIKTKSGWILMLGFTPDSTGAQLEEAFLQMIQSAKYESASQGVVGFANLSFQLPDRRLFCPKVVDVVVQLSAHRYLIRGGIDVTQMVFSCASELIQHIVPGLL